MLDNIIKNVDLWFYIHKIHSQKEPYMTKFIKNHGNPKTLINYINIKNHMKHNGPAIWQSCRLQILQKIELQHLNKPTKNEPKYLDVTTFKWSKKLKNQNSNYWNKRKQKI